MSREGPISFGKPLLYLTIVGCIGGGFYLWKTWPATYEGPGWKVDFPNGWETTPHNDPTQPGMMVSHGPLKDPEGPQGVGWVKLQIHGTIQWPQFPLEMIPGSPDKVEPDGELAHKKTMFFEYEDDKNMRYIGSATDRIDAVVIVAVGAPKHLFEENRERLEKCAKSLRVWR